MAITFKTSLVAIGNSRGVRLPKPFLDRFDSDEVELRVEDNQIVIRPISEPRAGWDKAFQRMGAAGDDQLLDNEAIASDFDKKDWRW